MGVLVVVVAAAVMYLFLVVADTVSGIAFLAIATLLLVGIFLY